MTTIKQPSYFQKTDRRIKANVEVRYLQLSNYKFSEQVLGGYVEEVGGYIIKPASSSIVKSGYEVPSQYSVRNYLAQAVNPTMHYGSIGDFKLDGETYIPKETSIIGNLRTGFVSDWFWDGEKYITNQAGSYWESETLSLLIPVDQTLDEIQLSIMFKNGYPKTIKIKPTFFSSETGYLEINEDNHNNYFTEDGTLIVKEPLVNFGNKIILEMGEWSEPNQRPVIGNLYLGIVRNYSNDEIISINTTCSTDVLSRETPANTCSVELVTHGEFDVLNKDSYIQYLNNKVEIHILYISEDNKNNVWYPAGSYYLQDWKNNDDSVILYGESIVSRLKEVCISAFDEQNFLDSYDDSEKLQAWLTNEYGTNGNYKKIVNINVGDIPDIGYAQSQMYWLPDRYLLTWLQKVALWSVKTITSNLDTLLFKKIVLDKSELQSIYLLRKEDCVDKEVKIIQSEKIKKLIMDSFIVRDSSGHPSSTFSTEVQITKNPQIIDIDPSPYYYEEYSDPSTIVVKDENNNIINDYTVSRYPGINLALKFNNQIGKKLTITVTTTHQQLKTEASGNGKGYKDELVINNEGVDLYFERMTGGKYLNEDFKERVKKLLSCNKNFEADTFGDPTLELGETILFETEYGNQTGIITSIDMTYDGGLRSTLKGLIIDDD